jgi:uncharacterized 2Fe-2S/4Fe-4S cluster protein (DUF4445 family)
MADETRYRVRFEPMGSEVEVPAGTPLARAATLAGLPFEQPCGGLGLCGKCRVTIAGEVRPPTHEEVAAFSAEELAAGERLACQLEVDRDLEVTPGDEALSHTNQILVGGLVRETHVDSGVERLTTVLPKAPLGDARDDWSRLCTTLERPLVPTLGVLRRFSTLLDEHDVELTVTAVGGEAVRVARGHNGHAPLGFAIDIGTTTLVCYLLDLTTGAELAHAAMLNPQVAHGDDVIARIYHCAAEADGLQRLRELVCTGIDTLLEQVCAQVDCGPDGLCRGTIVGNATMTHLFQGINPKGLGLAPFAPITHRSVTALGSEFGLTRAPDALLTVLPNIAGFLGSDTVGVVLASMPEPEQTCLAVDIGTNGEMVLYHDGRWYGCSAAAGPAFEGARISCGLRGATGAISRVDLADGDLACSIIEHTAPRGICGSGLLDAVAVLLQTGVLDPTGRLTGNAHTPPPLLARLAGEGPGRTFRLATADESYQGDELTLTARDIREVQLAKGSIRASIEALLARAGIGADDLRQVYLAGGFGSYLRVESAMAVGLLPPVPRERIVAVGNAAGAGARLALISRDEMARAERRAREVEVLDLANDMVYQMQLVEQMIFPD